MPWTCDLRGGSVSDNDLDYLIVATDYATVCAGTCPTCVLSRDERQFSGPATSVENIIMGLADTGMSYGKVKTVAVGIGRANVLALDPSSVSDIVTILSSAKTAFPGSEIIAEISTSLIGKIEPQIARAMQIVEATDSIGIDARFVVVANTALNSEKYWANLDRFLTELEDFRGGRERDNNGDILQLALAIDSLPDPSNLADRLGRYHFPVNITWAPGHDKGAKEVEGLERLGIWLEKFYRLTDSRDMDSSLVNRIKAAISVGQFSTLPEAAHHAAQSSKAVVYIAADGQWHNGLFTALAEMDPVRFDPCGEGRSMAAISAKELRRFITNPACAQCAFVGPCVTAGGHKIAQIALRNYSSGTSVCPNGLKGCFDAAMGGLLEMVGNGAEETIHA